MKQINLEDWKRKDHFAFFYKMDYAQYNICMDIDVTKFKKFTKQRELSFYYSMIFAVTATINRMEEFRYRIRGGKVVLHDIIHPSFTDMSKDANEDLFKIITVEMGEDLIEFVRKTAKVSKDQNDYFGLEKLTGRDDLVYITCLPLITFTHISHTVTLNRDDSVPRISWGKYYEKDSKILLPFSVQVHHALLDGFHVAKYVEALQEVMNELTQ